jgi:DUF4097 and DUF4098 domain-containing protein YvlB
MKKAVVLTAIGLMLGGALHASETTKNLDLAAQGIKRLEVRAGAGSLTVTGRDGLAAIEVKAEIVARHVRDEDMERTIKDRVELTLEKRGDTAVLVSRVRDSGRIFHFSDDLHINVTVSVPKTMALDIDDGSGGIVVEDIAAPVRIEDGSGPIRVERIAGGVRIDDASGEVVVRDVEGNVEIEDGSGGIEILDVTGNVSVDDGSGEILIRRVGGGVTVDDGSGGIDIEDVEKDIRLISTGSGTVSISGEKGRVIRSL